MKLNSAMFRRILCRIGSFVLIILLWPLISPAQAQLTGIGAVQNWKRRADGLEGATKNAFFRISVYNDHVIRVRVSRTKEMSDFSFVLADQKAVTGATGKSGPEGALKVSGKVVNRISEDLKITEDVNSIRLLTGSIAMEIEKAPQFRVIFRNKAGKIINEDVAGEGFCTNFIGTRTNLYKKLHAGERFVGLGEALGNLDRRGTAVTLNNTDTYRYGDPRMPMYVSIPFYIGIFDREVYGLFYHNTWKTFFNFGISTPDFTSVTAEGGDVDYFYIYDSGIGQILSHYTELTGRMPLPPKWSLGYHQSRCSYFPQDNVKILAATFRAKKIPIDCIVLDADYLQDYEPFRINTTRFPDMPGLTGYLKNLDLEVTASVNPGIKRDSSYFAHHDGLKKDIFLKFADGSLYTADIAPSTNNYPDFTKPAARAWWAENMKFLPDNGIHGYWNDMNEPAVGGSYLPDNIIFDFDGHRAGALEAKNLYGMLMARSSFESALKYGGNRRPFVLSRSGFAGIQRYAAVWTGDNTARDEYLLGGTLLNTQLGLSGLSFTGDDIGGYIGNTSRELFIRWIEVGVFAPYVRNHKEAFAYANEPWSYGEEAEAISREFIGFRYRLMPYLYSKFYESTRTGMPVARSLCINDPFDDRVYDQRYQYQFLCGDALMVVPVTPSEKVKKFYLPSGRWYDLYSDDPVTAKRELSVECPAHRIPLFVRESSVIPMQSPVQSAKERPGDTLFVHIYKGSIPNRFELYEDDGATMDYRNDQFNQRTITFDPEQKKIIFSKPVGRFNTLFRNIQCIFHGFGNGFGDLKLDGRPMRATTATIRMVDGLRYLESIYDPAYFKNLREQEQGCKVISVTIPNLQDEIIISWD